jgi:hypothetical protein
MFSQVLSITRSVSSDVLILGVAFVVFFLYSIYFGRNKTVALVFAYYPAVLLYKTFPFLSKLMLVGNNPTLLALNQVVLFLIFFLPLNIIISRFIFIESIHAGKPSMLHNVHIFRNVGLSFVCLTVVVLFSYTVVDLSPLHTFSSAIHMLFATPGRVWGMNLLPLALLAFL